MSSSSLKVTASTFPEHTGGTTTAKARLRRDHPLAPVVLRAYIWCLALAALVIQSGAAYTEYVVRGHLSDFGRFYHALLAWYEGGALYAPNIATPMILPDGTFVELLNVASPSWHLVAWPFTALSPAPAYLAWVLVNLVAWALSIRICVREWGLRVDGRWYPAIALALICSPLVSGAFHTGQYAALMMLPATLAWRAARRERWTAAGAWLGWLASHKPFVLVVLAWMVWHRQWRGVFAGLGTLAASVMCGVVVFGPDIYTQWQRALESAPTWTWLYVNASLWAPWARAFAPSPAYASAPHPELVTVPALGTAFAVAAFSWWRLRRKIDVDIAWAVLWAAGLLLSPLGWTYYLWLGLGPFGAVARTLWQTQPQRRWWLWGLGACAVLPLQVVIVGQPSIAASFTIGSMYTWALAAWWWVSVHSVPHYRS